MLTTDQINDLHRLYLSERWPIRKIERHLKMSWRTIKKYLDVPAQGPAQRQRESKLDPFKATITEWLEKDLAVTAALIEQRLRPLGYTGGHSILREYVRTLRPQLKPTRAFLRMEPSAGERFEVDWGHFDALDYQGDKRKLYAFALVEAHSRMLYLEFTHSQSFETFVRCHVHAFTALGGVAREIAYDNLATAVAEHDGRLVRFLPRFLAFAREYNFYPKACNPAAGWEKGKVERAIGYARQNFWPLREFTDLHDANRQARQWLTEIANQRQHRETRERPIDRFQAEALRPLPVIPYDHRDAVEALVHKDLRVQFDGNRYCVPHRYVGRRLTVKADSSSATFYERVHEIVSYPRCWRRGQTLGAERFERELAEPRPAAKRSRAQQRFFALLDGLCSQAMLEAYLRDIADTDRALSRQLTELLDLTFVSTDPSLLLRPSPKHPRPTRSVPITSPVYPAPAAVSATFLHHKSRQQAKPRILRLLDLEFLAKGTNLVFIGNPGVGKTFLAKVIAWRACQANQRVLFTTAMDMLNHFIASQVDHSVVRKLKTYTEPTLLICDELGYLALDQQTSNLLYQVISTRHSQKRSTIITTNNSATRNACSPSWMWLLGWA